MTLFEFNFNDIEYNYLGKVIQLKRKNFDLVLSVIVNNIIHEGVDTNGYTIIHSKKFITAYASYKVYINYFINRGILIRDYYIVGYKSWGYRFTELFKQQVQLTRIIYYPDKKVDKKVVKVTNQDCLNVDPKTLQRLKKNFRSCTIDFDLQKKQLNKTYDEWGNYIDIRKWFRNNLLLHKWQKGYEIFTFTTNRLYTNFTSLSSHVRKNNIKLNENLVEFDIPNSFPLMVSIYMRNENPHITSDYDFQQYCSSVISGTFYTSLMNGLNSIRNCNKKGNENDYSTRLLSRSEVKLLFQIYLNGDNNRQPYLNSLRPSINEYMYMKYPCVHEIILATKIGGKGNVYNTLVEIETKFIFDVIKVLYEKYDDIKILTCHDALYVSNLNYDKVKEVWDSKMNDLIKDLPFDSNEDYLNLPESRISIFEEDDI